MGTICAHPNEKDECNETVDTTKKNSVQAQGTLGPNGFVDLVLGGHYRYQRGESLLVIVEGKYLNLCDPLKQYTNEVARSIDMIQNMRKTFFKPIVNKACPFKKLLLCILPHYRSEQSQEYKQLFCNIIREALEDIKEVSLELNNTIEGVSTLPNQLLLSLLLKEVTNMKTGFKLSLVTTEKKMMSLYRYQLLKTDQFHFSKSITPDRQ